MCLLFGQRLEKIGLLCIPASGHTDHEGPKLFRSRIGTGIDVSQLKELSLLHNLLHSFGDVRYCYEKIRAL